MGNLCTRLILFACWFLFGIFLLSVFLIYVPFIFPIFFYKFLLCRFIAPYFPDIGECVAEVGHGFAVDFLGRDNEFVSRLAAVSCCTLEGTVPREEWRRILGKKWLQAKVNINGESRPKYPELQQYIEQWMGFMFWKWDKSFKLENHLFFHQAEPGNSKLFFDRLTEQLLNKPFTLKRSPWELHIVENYRDPELLENGGVMTAMVFRSHHALADGYSVLSLFIKDIFEADVEKNFPMPSTTSKNIEGAIQKLLRGVLQIILFPFELLYAVGHVHSPILKRKVPWFISDGKKSHKQFYQKSPLIPVHKIKAIKNTFKVGFTSVVLSCITAGMVHDFKRKGYFPAKGETTPIGTTIPLPNHPKKLINYFVGAPYFMPIGKELDSIERLRAAHGHFQDMKDSNLTRLLILSVNIFLNSLAPVTKFWSRNRGLSAILSNFAVPATEIVWNEKRMFSVNFAVAGLHGVAGVLITIVSFREFIQFTVAAESGVMTRNQLDQLIHSIRNEIDTLYDLSTKLNQNKN